MFRPLGSFIPTAVLTDIGLFFDKDQLHKFSLASPKANGLFKSYRMMAYKKVIICPLENNKISIELQALRRIEKVNTSSPVKTPQKHNKKTIGHVHKKKKKNVHTKRKIYIDTNKEDSTEKMAIFLSTCRSINECFWFGGSLDELNWENSIINEQLMELMLKIEIKYMLLADCSISVSLPLFLKFLYRHGKILSLSNVKLPSELVSNKTLSLISDFHIRSMPGTDLVVDVNDEFLEGYNTSFDINGFITKFTIKGISAFIQKKRHYCPSFGILASDQMQDAIDYEIAHRHAEKNICLMSNDGQKDLNFCVGIGNSNWVTFSINLETTESDQSGMVPIPNNLFGIVEKESFLKFNKIFANPEELLPISQYQLESLSIDYEDCVFNIAYIIRGENRDICIKRTDVNLKDTHKIIVEILRNCTAINSLHIPEIKLDEDFYHLLKPIADNIHVPKWYIESTLESESLNEVQSANSGLFAKIKLIFDEDDDETDEDEDEFEDEGLLR